jgi:hypothetical protein
MKYDVKEKLEWTVIFLFEFGHKYGLSGCGTGNGEACLIIFINNHLLKNSLCKQ